MADFWEAVAGNLQQRVAEIVAKYEGELVTLRVRAQEEMTNRDNVITELQNKLNDIEDSNKDISEDVPKKEK